MLAARSSSTSDRQDAGFAVGDVQFGGRAGRGRVLRRGLDALVEDAGRDERRDAQGDAGDDQRRAVPPVEQVAALSTR